MPTTPANMPTTPANNGGSARTITDFVASVAPGLGDSPPFAIVRQILATPGGAR